MTAAQRRTTTEDDFDFANLPDFAILRERHLRRLLSVSRPTIWRMVKSGRLPKPRSLGPRSKGWTVGEIRAFVEEAGNQR